MLISSDILRRIAPNAKKEIIDDLANHLSTTLVRYDINTKLRVAHFLAQAAHESAGFRTLREYWGPTDAQRRYEGRKDLGNVQTGDGKRFMGRGIFQLTGRANYARYSKILGVDFVSDPEIVATAKYSMLIACEYWKDRKINTVADADDVTAVTKKINGGTNGLADRTAYLKRAKLVMDEVFAKQTPAAPVTPVPPKPVETTPEPVVVPDNRPMLVIMKKGDRNDGVKMIQIILNQKLGIALTPDGDFGQATEDAVIAFQKKMGNSPALGLVTADVYSLLTSGV